MMVFRGCPKCEGDLYIERALPDDEVVCLQCGYRHDLPRRD
jgi:hypothetical protein